MRDALGIPPLVLDDPRCQECAAVVEELTPLDVERLIESGDFDPTVAL